MPLAEASLKRFVSIFFLVFACATFPAQAQRRPVLPQIHEPHPYYFRELYLPQLTSGPSFLSWSPNSTELAYSMAGSLWRQNIDSTTATQLTDGNGYDYQPDWSPDGQTIIFVRYEKNAMELWQLDLATGKAKQLTTGGAVNVEPRWSPDGKKLVWVSTQSNGRFHIFIADYANGELRNAKQLVSETKSSPPRYYYSAYDMEINPTWSRDGKEILFVSNRGHIHGTGGFWITKAQPKAKSAEIHYEETSWKARPDFSPDGSRMVYSSYLGGQWQNLWVMPARGGDAFPISYGDWDETNPRWSPDGNRIAFISNQYGNTEIAIQNAANAKRQYLRIVTHKYQRPHFPMDIRGEGVARISVTDSVGHFFAPNNTRIFTDDGFDPAKSPTEAHYFYGPSDAKSLHVPEGTYTVLASRGPAYRPISETIQVGPQRDATIDISMKPLIFEPDSENRWMSADLHVHMNYAGTYRNSPDDLALIAYGEGLDQIHELTVNKEQRFPDHEFVEFGTRTFPVIRVSIIQGQEFHTSYWGHRGILGLGDHLLLPGYAGYPNTAAASLVPMNADVYDAAHAQGAVVGAVHPFDELPDPFAKPAQRITDELPVDVALGKIDYMEIVGFSDHKSTAAVWYKLLNLGFHIPAGAGTDATTNYSAPIRGQVGFDRVYLRIPKETNNSGVWRASIQAGRTFATNGPLIDFSLDGKIPGDEIRYEAPQQSVKFTATLRSFVPVDHLELVCNGKVLETLKLDATRASVDAAGTIPLSESGWCVLRAWSDVAEWPVFDNYTYATTSPIYVTIAGKRPYSADDAKYFEAWIDRVIEATSAYPDWNAPAEKQYVLKRLHEGRTVYENLH
jgi:TolB protein